MPTLKTIAKIATALKVTIDKLINEEQDFHEADIKDKICLIDELPDEEKMIVLKVIDMVLLKKKFKDF